MDFDYNDTVQKPIEYKVAQDALINNKKLIEFYAKQVRKADENFQNK